MKLALAALAAISCVVSAHAFEESFGINGAEPNERYCSFGFSGRVLITKVATAVHNCTGVNFLFSEEAAETRISFSVDQITPAEALETFLIAAEDEGLVAKLKGPKLYKIEKR